MKSLTSRKQAYEVGLLIKRGMYLLNCWKCKKDQVLVLLGERVHIYPIPETVFMFILHEVQHTIQKNASSNIFPPFLVCNSLSALYLSGGSSVKYKAISFPICLPYLLAEGYFIISIYFGSTQKPLPGFVLGTVQISKDKVLATKTTVYLQYGQL